MSVPTEEETELSAREEVRIAVRWMGHQHRHVQLEVQHNLVQTIWKKEAVSEDCAISLVRSFGEEEDQQDPQRRPWSCVAVLRRLVNLYRVSREECARLREGVPYVKVYRCNPKHLYPKLNGYRDNGQRSLKL